MDIKLYNPEMQLPSTSEESWFGTQVHLIKDVDNNSLLIVETNLFDRIWAIVKWFLCCCNDYETILIDRHVSTITLEEAKALHSSAKADRLGNTILQVTSENNASTSITIPKDVLRLIFTGFDSYVDEDTKAVCRFTCRYLRDLCNPFIPLLPGFCWRAAQVGNLTLLQWARTNGAPWGLRGYESDTCTAAGASGHLAVLQWARTDTAPWWKKANRAPWNSQTLEFAAEQGHLNILMWAYDNGAVNDFDTGTWSNFIERAAYEGHFDIVKWADSKNIYITSSRVCESAAARGNFAMLQWALARGTEWGAACYTAAKGKHFEMLKWAHSNGAPFNGLTSRGAIQGGHFEILKWAHAQGDPLTEKTCETAARTGNLEMLQYLREVNTPWNTRTCSAAAANGHKHVLEWAFAHGASMDHTTIASAADGGHLEILQWIITQGIILEQAGMDRLENPELYVNKASRRGNLEMLVWLLNNGAPWHPEICDQAVIGGQLHVLQWAHGNGLTWNVKNCKEIAICWYDLARNNLIRNPHHRQILTWIHNLQ